MKRKIKELIVFLSLFSVVFLSILGIKANASSSLTVTLEEQESSDSSSIRYISTVENLTDLSTVTDITVSLSYTHGSTIKYTSDTLTTVYTSVSGTNGKEAAENTYYAVYTLTDIDSYCGYTFDAQFIYNLSDGTTLSTNTVSYTVPSDYTVTDGTGSYLSTAAINEALLADTIQDGVIFHAWDWSMSTIESHLSEIKAQGFTTIQTSPMQPQKDYYASDDADAWWKMYQPLGFQIATENNALGTKDDLEELCTEAHKLGLSIIVDVVANHLAGDSVTQLSSAVAEYEPEIYGDDGTLSGGALLHSNTGNTADDSSASSVTTGNIGMPDLDTSNSIVQEAVLDLLEEYIDVGVDGFRFDAAKHIETPSDGDAASDYWTVILEGATAYAQKERNFTPYYYGEILNTPGTGRSWSYYTGMMSITDNVTGNNIRTNINSGSASAAASSTYNTGESAGNLVLWGESHDTYSNNECESTFIDQLVVDKAYALCASRTGATSLYFARPTDGTFGTESNGTLTITCTTALGAMGSDHWETDYIGDVNKFHNYWDDASEYLGSSGSFAYNIRYDSSESGMVIVAVDDSTSVSITGATNMLDGTYIDMVSGNTFTVSSGSVTGTMASSGIAVLYSTSEECGTAYVTSSADSVFTDDLASTTFTIANCKSATLTIDGKTSPVYNGSVVTFGSDMSTGDSKTITVTLTDDDGNTSDTAFTFTKAEATTIYFINSGSWDSVYAHMWNSSTGDSTTWPGTMMTDTGNTSGDYEVYSISFTSGTYDSIIFNDGGNSYQTTDITLSDSYDCYTLGTSKDSSGNYYTTASVYGCVTHTYGTTYSYDENYHYYVCTVCGATTGTAVHTFTSEITTEPTSTTTGVRTYTCSVCGYSYTETIAVTGHTHSYTAVVTDPSCCYSGYTTYTCSCGDSYIGNITEATGHSWGSAEVVTKVTRTTDGEVEYTCSICGATKTVTVEATGTTIYFVNNWKWETPYIYAWNSEGSNASWPGVKLSTVVGTSDVYDVYSYDIGDYTNFIFSNGSDSDKSGDTEVDDSISSYEMSYDSDTEAKNCVDANYTPLPDLCDEHTWDSGVIVTEATEDSCGTTLYTCTVCGDTKTELTEYTS